MITRINCYPVCENHFDEFFITPRDYKESIEVRSLKKEIAELRQIIVDKDKFIQSNGLEYFTPKKNHRKDSKREWGKFRRMCVHPPG